jgi:hypothetical protein
MILESASETDSLLTWGISTKGISDDADHPGVITDVFMRVAPKDSKQNPASVKNMIEINTPHVILDNTWLWRAN